MSEECKTLEAYLAPPIQHKQCKLHDEHNRYEKLLRRSFNNECDTMTAVNEVVTGEYLNGITDEDIGKYWNRRLGKWLFSQLQSSIEDKAAERGIPVEYVYPHHTSKTCHACQNIGYRPHQGTFRCTNEDCWVSEYQADLNAAANIANRLNPWGKPALEIGRR